MTDGLRKSHLRKSHQVGLFKVGLPDIYCDGHDMREEGGRASASCSLEFSEKRRLHVPPATKEHKESCSFVSTKELDENIEDTYLTELSLEEDVPTNAQSTHRLVL